jgi:Phage minor capsid protein 2.
LSRNKNDDSYDLRKIFEEIELELVKSMRRTLTKHELEEEELGFQWEQWQSAKLRNLTSYRKQNEKIIDGRSKEIEELVNNTIQQNYVKNVVTRKKQIDIPKDVSTFKGSHEPKEESFFHINDQKIKTMQEVVNGDIKRGQSAALRRMNDIYRQTIYRAEMHMVTGAKTLQQAVDMATKDFLNSGINCIEYKNGRKVNIASYAEMALRTAGHRATLLGEGKKRDEWGIHTVIVSSHANTCPHCERWQGEVLIDDVFSSGTLEEALEGRYYLLSFAIESKFLHPNCRHTIMTYFPGITQVPVVQDGKTAVKRYEAEQKQRRIETQIRKWKRIAEGSLDPDNINYANGKVREYQKELREHIDDNPWLRRDYSREKTRDIPYQPKEYRETGGKFDKGHTDWLIRRDAESEDYYNTIRKRIDDISKISKNTGWNEESIIRIKNHVFMNKHILDGNRYAKYDGSYDMSVAWQRLINGNYEKRDILLLKHEYLESIVEKKYNSTYREAHSIAMRKHDWNREIEEVLGRYGESDILHELIREE